MIAEAKRQRVRPYLATIPPMVPGSARSCGIRLVDPLNARIRTLAAAEGVSLVDVFAGMGANYQQYIGPDGLHPNTIGYDKIASIFFDVLRGTLEISGTTTTTFGAPIPVFPRSPARPRR
jgi:lysophospholipase L1-like esterase